MPTLTGQKSSYSGSGENDCVEIATNTGGHPFLRESDAPAHVLAPTGAALTGLLRHLKAGEARPR